MTILSLHSSFLSISFASVFIKAAFTEQLYYFSQITFDVNVQYSLAYDTFISVYVERKKTFLFNVKTKNCPISCREAQKDVGMSDLRVTYNANVITVVRMANVRLLHDHRKTQVRFLWASHVAIGNPSPNKIVYDTYD